MLTLWPINEAGKGPDGCLNQSFAANFPMTEIGAASGLGPRASCQPAPPLVGVYNELPVGLSATISRWLIRFLKLNHDRRAAQDRHAEVMHGP